jgi:hypothetical protein
MKKFQRAVLLPALSFGLAFPALAIGPGQDTQGSVMPEQAQKSAAIQSDNVADQTAQSQAEQPRLPAEKEGASSSTGQSPSEMSPDSAGTTSKKIEGTSQANKSPANQNKDKKHPPTAVMDRATPAEKSTSEGVTPSRHPPTSVMDRVTPDQKSPESTTASGSRQMSGEPAVAKDAK